MLRLLLLFCCLHLGSCQENSGDYVAITYGKFNWFEAAQICHQSGMILGSVTSFDQQQQLIRSIKQNGHLLDQEGFWLGASNLGDLVTWTWQDLGIPLGYKNWGVDEPQLEYVGRQSCMVIGLDQSWYSEDCHSEYFVICQRFNSYEILEPLYI